ncbi:cystatin-like [Actinia tenebrosa]|uniref:Cystatin-like n=1 Tax=Actinia tenebrosa TaxID=6105 RepID=A0A6P8IDR0_ACTTE|nr:cystatin-like [Actinia tenebrosa]
MAAFKQCCSCFLVLLTIWCLFYTVTSSLVGGIQPIDDKDIAKYEDLLKGLELAAVEVNREIKEKMNDANSNRKYGFLKQTLHVSSQVVQGSLFHVTTDMAPSDCSDQDPKPILECSVDGSDPLVQTHTYSCTFKIWSREWLPPKEGLLVEDLKCTLKSAGGEI